MEFLFDYKYAYLLGNLFLLLPVWAVLFWLRPDKRKEMLIVSLLTGFAGPLSELWYLQDYWNPETFNGWPIGFEDYLFGFGIGGIASVAYEVFSRRYYMRKKDHRYKWLSFLLPVSIAFLALFNVLFFSGINSIYASIIAFLAVAAVFIFFRPDLARDALLSGLVMGLLMFLGYMFFLAVFPEAIERFWQLKNLSGVLVRGVPIEELLWAFGLGMIMGPAYEFFTGRRLKNGS